MTLFLHLYLFFCVLAGLPPANPQTLYSSTSGRLVIGDSTTGGVIVASESLQGFVQSATRTFSFSVPVRSIDASPGQEYAASEERIWYKALEPEIYPEVIFDGDLQGLIDFNTTGEYHVKASGTLSLHGKSLRVNAHAKISTVRDAMMFTAEMHIIPAHYGIIPKGLTQKADRPVKVRIECELNRKPRY